jgi:hypothetical protein
VDRFSTFSLESDGKPDVRGTAIKVMGVEGEAARQRKLEKTQDFLRSTPTSSFSPNTAEYVKFSRDTSEREHARLRALAVAVAAGRHPVSFGAQRDDESSDQPFLEQRPVQARRRGGEVFGETVRGHHGR